MRAQNRKRVAGCGQPGAPCSPAATGGEGGAVGMGGDGSPVGTGGNSPAIHRWEEDAPSLPFKSCRDDRIDVCQRRLCEIRPSRRDLAGYSRRSFPAMNRWAITARPYGTAATQPASIPRASTKGISIPLMHCVVLRPCRAAGRGCSAGAGRQAGDRPGEPVCGTVSASGSPAPGCAS